MANSPVCSIPNCGKPAARRGWCNAHYLRNYRHGTPLTGGTRHGDPMRFYTEAILTYGGDECLLWPHATDKAGYPRMRVNGRSQYVTRLLCEELYGPAPTPKHEAAHTCGRGSDGCVTKRHLEWKTRAENEGAKIEHGTSNRGARNGRAKLSDTEMVEIRALKGIKTRREIAALYGIHFTHVTRVQR